MMNCFALERKIGRHKYFRLDPVYGSYRPDVAKGLPQLFKSTTITEKLSDEPQDRACSHRFRAAHLNRSVSIFSRPSSIAQEDAMTTCAASSLSMTSHTPSLDKIKNQSSLPMSYSHISGSAVMYGLRDASPTLLDTANSPSTRQRPQ